MNRRHLTKFGFRERDAVGMDGICRACGNLFKKGDYTTLIALGPGDDPEEQEKCREGHPFNAVAIEIHWACATGEEP